MSQSLTDTDRIERELDSTRARMDDRLSALGDRLSPGQLLDDLMKQIRGSEGGAFANDLVQSIKANPLPAALTGIGLAWLMASNPQPGAATRNTANTRWSSSEELDREFASVSSRVDRRAGEEDIDYQSRLYDAQASFLGVKRAPDDTHESFSSKIESGLKEARDRIAQMGQNIAGQVGSVVGAAGDAAQAAADRVASAADAAPKLAADLYASISDNPVLLGSIGLAVGALLGAVVPQSRQEQQALSGMAAKARDATAAVAQEVVDRGTEMADAAMNAGRESLKSHGMSGDKSLSEIATEAKTGELIEGVKQVAEDVLKAVEPHQDGSSKGPRSNDAPTR